MPFNLLLFPLLGGYYFLVTFESRHKYTQLRFSDQKLLFNSAIAGIALLTISFLATSVMSYFFKDFVSWVVKSSPIDIKYFWTSILSFLIACVSANILNLWRRTHRLQYIRQAIDAIGNELEVLLKKSFDEEILINITLKNNKFYIGWASALPIPSQSKFISIIPAYSGYRDEKTKELMFTTQYLEIYSTFIKEGKVKSINDLGVNQLINVNEMLSVSQFDPVIYERFAEGEEVSK